MPDRGEGEWESGDRARLRRQEGLFAASLTASARALEAEQDRWFLWLPVLFAGGILTYFALAEEPAARLAAALVLGAIGLCLAARHMPLGLCLGGALLAFASGFAAAKFRTEMARAPVLAHELHYVSVTGFVEAHELRGKGRARVTLRVLSLGDLQPDQRPYRVRVSLSARDGAGARIGEAVALHATLQPPPEPLEPGGFDFGRQAWFARLGATGYATSKLAALSEARAPPWDLAAGARIDAVRAAVNARIRAALPEETGEIAAALITGERGGISEEVNQAMRDSGLAHVLSISGLHMVIMAGTVFWLIRALLALVPGLALRHPIKKWAAAAALVAATFYLALSGAAVPTVRSWIMMSIVLIAVMLDRPRLTMRNVAFAALAILVVAPDSLFDPSFEMSFAAVIALLSLLAMPFGLEAWPLQAMGLGIELMVATGQWVASFPGAVSILPQISGQALVLIVLGGLWLCLWHTRTRALGLVIAAAGLALAPQAERPDVLIERDGGTAALRSGSGSLVFPPATAAGYSVDNWLLADGDERDASTLSDESVFRCDFLGCIGVVKGKTVALIRHPGALEEDCRLADIVIAPFTVRKCRAARVIVDRRMLKAKGAHALYIEGLSIRTETVAASRGRRPWVPDRAMVEATPPPTKDEAEAVDRRLDGDPEE